MVQSVHGGASWLWTPALERGFATGGGGVGSAVEAVVMAGHVVGIAVNAMLGEEFFSEQGMI